MLTSFLLRKFINGDKDYKDKDVRTKVGYLASIVGVIVNIFLAIIKFSIGYAISSVSVTADALNNLADTGSSIVTIVGFRMANKPADKNHPYGHGRIEYIAALIVAFMVILVGVQFIQTSFDRIINPRPVSFEIMPLIVLTISIAFKIWLMVFNKDLGGKINSSGLKATAQDALGDVLTTSVVVLSIVIGGFNTLPIDGIVGIIVSLLIIYNGIDLVKETISPLIGEAPSKELLDSIMEDVLSYDHITGAHDLYVHSYGAYKTMAMVDVEFPATVDVVTIHRIIHEAEKDIGEKYDLTLVIHMDPLHEETEEEYELRQETKKIINKYPQVKSMHDFHVIDEDGSSQYKRVEFHLVVDGNQTKLKEGQEIKNKLKNQLEERFDTIIFDIIVDVKFFL